MPTRFAKPLPLAPVRQPRLASPSPPSPASCWRVRRKASCRTLTLACSPKPNAKSSPKPSRWQRATRRKPRAGLGCPDLLCAKNSNNLVCIQTPARPRSEEHTSELQSLTNIVCRLLLEKKKILQFNQSTLHYAFIRLHASQ